LGEPDDPHRWPRIVNRTIVALARDVRHGGTLFGIELGGRVRLRRIGFLGHSLSGFNSARRAVRRAREDDPLRIARGLGALSALFLLARSQARAWSTCRARWSSAPATPTPEQPDGAT